MDAETNRSWVKPWPGNKTSPWFHLDEGTGGAGGADPRWVVIGRFTGGGANDGRASVGWQDRGTHRIVYSATTELPRAGEPDCDATAAHTLRAGPYPPFGGDAVLRA
jgi:hypothetical protein